MNGKDVLSHSPFMLKNKATGMYLRTEGESEGWLINIWLSESGSPIMLKIANRYRKYTKILNDRDIVLLSIDIKSERCLLGV